MSNTVHHLEGTMKLLLVILAFSIVMQICTGGKCGDGGGRFKRSTDYAESRLKEFIDFAKDVVNQSGAIITAVMDRIPVTEEYNAYREELEAFLLKLDRYKARSGKCATKSLEVMTAFLMLTQPYEQENITAEAQQVYTIMNSNGFLELEQKAGDWMEAFDEDMFQREYNEMLTSDHNTNVSSMFMEIC